MGRWEPGAEQRLQHAALTLFLERGYENVTVAQIAEHAGLTRRTFFNHFADKREIFSSGAVALQAAVAAHLDAADPSLSPLETAVSALAHAGDGLAEYRPYAAQVRQIMATAPELRERELSKLAILTTLITDHLQRRGSDARTATIAAHIAVTAFTLAWDDGVTHAADSFTDLMTQVMNDVAAVARARDAATGS